MQHETSKLIVSLGHVAKKNIMTDGNENSSDGNKDNNYMRFVTKKYCICVLLKGTLFLFTPARLTVINFCNNSFPKENKLESILDGGELLLF